MAASQIHRFRTSVPAVICWALLALVWVGPVHADALLAADDGVDDFGVFGFEGPPMRRLAQRSRRASLRIADVSKSASCVRARARASGKRRTAMSFTVDVVLKRMLRAACSLKEMLAGAGLLWIRAFPRLLNVSPGRSYRQGLADALQLQPWPISDMPSSHTRCGQPMSWRLVATE